MISLLEPHALNYQLQHYLWVVIHAPTSFVLLRKSVQRLRKQSLKKKKILLKVWLIQYWIGKFEIALLLNIFLILALTLRRSMMSSVSGSIYRNSYRKESSSSIFVMRERAETFSVFRFVLWPIRIIGHLTPVNKNQYCWLN